MSTELSRLVEEDLARIANTSALTSGDELKNRYAEQSAALAQLDWASWVQGVRIGVTAG